MFSTTASNNVTTPLSAVAAESLSSIGSVSPSSSVLEDLARSTPGSSMYNAFKYDIHSEAPYPLWWLDPNESIYKTLISAARSASDALHLVHDYAGLPWWAAIVLAGALARTVTLPLNIMSLRNASRAQDAKEDIMAVRNAYLAANVALTRQQIHNSSLRAAQSSGTNGKSDVGTSIEIAQKQTRNSPSPLLLTRMRLVSATFRGYLSALHKANCYPLRSLMVPLIQLPWMFTALLGARHAVLLGDTSFEKEGLLWFTDLTTPDPFFALPAISLGLAYISLETIFASHPSKTTTTTNTSSNLTSTEIKSTSTPITGSASLFGAQLGSFMKNSVQTLIILSIPFASSLPAGLHLLMAANSAWTMTYLALVRNPAVYQLMTGRSMPISSNQSSSIQQARFESQQSSPSTIGNRGGGGSTGGGDSNGSLDAPFRVQSTSTNSLPSITIAISSMSSTPNPTTGDSAQTLSASADSSVPRTPSHDSALFAQALPRLLYLESLITQREESSLITVLLRTLNRAFPVLWGHANPLVLQIAGGSARAPWNIVPARMRTNSRQQRGSHSIQTASTVAGGGGEESSIQNVKGATSASSENEANTVIGENSSVIDETTANDLSMETASDIAKESFRTRWLNGAAVFILNKPIHRPNRDNTNSFGSSNQQHSPLVIYPGDIGVLSLDAWRLHHNGRSTSAAEASQVTLPTSSLPIRVNVFTGAYIEPTPRDVRKARTLTPRTFRFIRSDVNRMSYPNSKKNLIKSLELSTALQQDENVTLGRRQRSAKLREAHVKKEKGVIPLYSFECNSSASALSGLRHRSRYFYSSRARVTLSRNLLVEQDPSHKNRTASASMNLLTLSQRLITLAAKNAKSQEDIQQQKSTKNSTVDTNDQESDSSNIDSEQLLSSSYETLARALSLYDSFAKHNRTRAAATAFEMRSQSSRANRFASLSQKNNFDAIRRTGESMWLPFTQSNQEGFASSSFPQNGLSDNNNDDMSSQAEESSSSSISSNKVEGIDSSPLPARAGGNATQNHGLELHEWLLEAEESFKVTPATSSSTRLPTIEHSKVKGGGGGK
jgi:membrane protein insertase Oxa1/YidC/SpoIIIJ